MSVIFRQLLMDLPGVGGFSQFSLWTPDTSCQFCQWSPWKNGWQRYSISWPIFLETNLSNELLGSSLKVTLTWLWGRPGARCLCTSSAGLRSVMKLLWFFFLQPPESCGSANEYPQLGFRPLSTCTGKHAANVCWTSTLWWSCTMYHNLKWNENSVCVWSVCVRACG